MTKRARVNLIIRTGERSIQVLAFTQGIIEHHIHKALGTHKNWGQYQRREEGVDQGRHLYSPLLMPKGQSK
jgi:hypothetical protein